MLTKLIKIKTYNGIYLNFSGINQVLAICFVKKKTHRPPNKQNKNKNKNTTKNQQFQKVSRIQNDHLSSLVTAKLRSLVSAQRPGFKLC